MRFQIFCLSWILLFAAHSANAATRTVYFSQVGRNSAAQGLGEEAKSTCRITVANPSTVAQTIKYEFKVSATGIGAGDADPDPSAPASGQSIAAGDSKTWIFTYKPFPPDVNGTQELICSGSITAEDPPSSNPGFVIASGVLTTFVESGDIQTEHQATGATIFGGFAVYTQVPIIINRGSPF